MVDHYIKKQHYTDGHVNMKISLYKENVEEIFTKITPWDDVARKHFHAACQNGNDGW